MKLEKIIQLIKLMDADSVIQDSVIEHLENTELKLQEARMLLVSMEAFDTPDKLDDLFDNLGRLEDLLYEI